MIRKFKNAVRWLLGHRPGYYVISKYSGVWMLFHTTTPYKGEHTFYVVPEDTITEQEAEAWLERLTS